MARINIIPGVPTTFETITETEVDAKVTPIKNNVDGLVDDIHGSNGLDALTSTLNTKVTAVEKAVEDNNATYKRPMLAFQQVGSYYESSAMFTGLCTQPNSDQTTGVIYVKALDIGNGGHNFGAADRLTKDDFDDKVNGENIITANTVLVIGGVEGTISSISATNGGSLQFKVSGDGMSKTQQDIFFASGQQIFIKN